MTRNRILSVLWLSALVAAAWGLRAPFLHREQWNLDEGSTFTMAQQIREGAVLYRDAVDQRAPLVPYLKAAIFWIAGDWNVYAVHLALALALGAAAFLLYDLARRLGHAAVGAWSAAAFTLLTFGMPGYTDGFAAHTEWFLILFSIAGVWLFARLYRNGGFVPGTAIGVCFAAAMLCKQPALFDLLVLWVLIAILACAHPERRSPLLHLWFGTLVGVLVVGAATAVFFWQYGALRDAIYYAWTYNLQFYIPEVPRLQRLAGIVLPFRITFEFSPALALLAIAGAITLLVTAFRWLRKFADPVPLLAWLTLGWCASGLAATMLSGRLYEHYGIQIIPGVSLACGWVLAHSVAWLRSTQRSPLWLRGLAWVGLIAVIAWTSLDVVRFRRKISGENDPHNDDLRQVVGRYSKPSDPIFVWGYFPDAYLATRRLPSTRFIYPNFLTGLIPWTNLELSLDTRYAIVPGAWDAFWQDYRAKPPVVIVDTNLRGYLKYPLLAQSRLRDEVIEHFAIVQKSRTEQYWMRVLRRLDETAAPPAPTAPNVDGRIQLQPAPIESIPDVIALTIVDSQPGSRVTVRLGGKPYRQLTLPAGEPVEITFFVRTSDLAAEGSQFADAIVERAGETRRSAPLDLARQLALDPQPAAPAPILHSGNDRIVASPPEQSKRWTAEPRGDALGWRTTGPFTLGFIRPAGMDSLSFDWQAAALRRGKTPAQAPRIPDVVFTPDHGTAVALSPAVVLRPYGRETLSVDLPHGQAGRVDVRWSAPDAKVVVSPMVWIGELFGRANGPGLKRGTEIIPPTLATANDTFWTQTGATRWAGPMPARLVYPRTRMMNSFVFHYGLPAAPTNDTPAAAAGGAILEVNFLHADGHSENLLSKSIHRAGDATTAVDEHARIGLPEKAEGSVELKFKATDGAESAHPLAYVSAMRVQGMGPDLVISPERVLTPTDSAVNGGQPIHTFANGRWIAHAPGHVVYPCPADLKAVTIGFGIEEGAYQAEDGGVRTNGVDVIAEFRDDSEKPVELFHRRLDPHTVVGDRGPQTARLELPGREGRLVLHIGPGPHNDTGFDWSYWTDFTGEVTNPASASGGAHSTP